MPNGIVTPVFRFSFESYLRGLLKQPPEIITTRP